MAKNPSHTVFTLHVQLLGINPLIWRRLVVDGDTSLGKLHHYLQVAMGWTDSHLHEFRIGDRCYGNLKHDADGELEHLDERKVKGHDFSGAGKRVDALLKTQGLISALSFGEIKTHTASLLKPVATAYRRECWQVSDELAGGIAQVQRSVQASLGNIRSKTEMKDDIGEPTGELVFLYQPRSFLVIGSLTEFHAAHGINEEKYSSFELFRRNLKSPEIVTFDELFERAKYIVESGGQAK